jgi:anti-sigma factor RsiW
MEQQQNLSESETRLYSDLEVELLINEISAAALEAIERAAAEAAKAAALAGVEREAAALREVQHWKMEAEKAKKASFKNAVITGVICFFGGLVVGVTINK